MRRETSLRNCRYNYIIYLYDNIMAERGGLNSPLFEGRLPLTAVGMPLVINAPTVVRSKPANGCGRALDSREISGGRDRVRTCDPLLAKWEVKIN
jgi:hypothetical protein